MEEGYKISDFAQGRVFPSRGEIIRIVTKTSGALGTTYFEDFFHTPLVQHVVFNGWHDAYVHLFGVQMGPYRKLPYFYALDTPLSFHSIPQKLAVFEFLLFHIDTRGGIEKMWTTGRGGQMMLKPKYWYLLFWHRFHPKCPPSVNGWLLPIYNVAAQEWHQQKREAFAVFVCIRKSSKDVARLVAELILNEKRM
jgi:hypothetical protein